MPLEIIAPAENHRLTTIATVRAETGMDPDQLDDAAVGALIDQASGLVAEHCNRIFAREKVKETFPCPTGRALILNRTPVVSVDGVVGAGGAGYSLDPAAGLVYRTSGHWSGVTSITYTAGYSLPGETGRDLPMRVERATVLIAAVIISNRQRDALVKSVTVDGIGRTDYWLAGQTSSLNHPEAEALLAPLVRPGVA